MIHATTPITTGVGELNRDSVVAKIATTAADGKTYGERHYNLDEIGQ